jgi:two-component system NtrC family sensor kinase
MGIALVTMAIALVVLFGWATDNATLKTIFSGLAAMNPTSAIGFILAGACLLIDSGAPSQRAARIGRAAAVAVLLIGACKLADIAGLKFLAPDELLFHSHGVQANPMAPNTALCFVLTSIALLSIDVRLRKNVRPAQLCAVAVQALGMFAVIGYAFSASSLYHLSTFFPMAVHTALLFCLLGTGILFLRPTVGIMRVLSADNSAGALARRLVPITMALPAAIGLLGQYLQTRGRLNASLEPPMVVLANTVIFTTLLWLELELLNRAEVRQLCEMTERKRIAEERDRFFTLGLDMVCVSDFEGYFKRVNGAFETTLGYTPEELMSRRYIEFVHPEDRESTLAEARRLAAGAVTIAFENRYRCKDGSYKWLMWMSVPVVKEQRLYAVARDMTERKKAEADLREKNRLLECAIESERAARRALQTAQGQLVESEKMAGLGQMVAGVAHEINNPLSFVSNNVAVLDRDITEVAKLLKLYGEAEACEGETRKRIIEQIRLAAERIDLTYTLSNLGDLIDRSREGLKRIQQIVKDLRDFARLDQSDLQEADMNAGVESTINIIRGYAKRRQIQIQTELGKLPSLRCHAAKLNQVLMNLIVNAIDASHDQGIVTVRSSAEPDGSVRIDIIDRGEGIDPAIRQRIFDPFFTTKPIGKGTGLGLSISYGIVHDHRGRIDVESTPGKGSMFSVRIPPYQKSIDETPAGAAAQA